MSGFDASPLHQANHRTVMLVDDDPRLREFVARILRGAGFTLLEAGDGVSALELSGSCGSPVDLLVTDVSMPGMTGWELAECLRGRWPGLRTLIMSGWSAEAKRPRGPRTRFVEKPFRVDTLLENVSRLLATA